MLSKNLTLEIAVNQKRLLTSVMLHDREAGVAMPIPGEDARQPYLAVRTVYDRDTTTVVLENEGLQQLAEFFESASNYAPPRLEVNYWEINEILFNRTYATKFAHGTNDHLERVLINKLIEYIVLLGGDVYYGGMKHADNSSNTENPEPTPENKEETGAPDGTQTGP